MGENWRLFFDWLHVSIQTGAANVAGYSQERRHVLRTLLITEPELYCVSPKRKLIVQASGCVSWNNAGTFDG
jgi:hypothetical protein